MMYNVFALPVAAGLLYPLNGFHLPPAFAGLSMAFSSVSVVCSSLALRLYRRPMIHGDGRIEHTGVCSKMSNGCSRCFMGVWGIFGGGDGDDGWSEVPQGDIEEGRGFGNVEMTVEF
jgi:hypothetical protein